MKREPELVKAAREAMTRAIAPYSNFQVGAALMTKSGEIYLGGNIESSSYGLTICAERVALFKALSEGERDFETIAIAADTKAFCPPCGACRQVLADYADGCTIILVNAEGETRKTTLAKLLPEAFGSSFLQS